MAIAGNYAAGSVLESEDDAGLASLSADALIHGTETRSFLAFSQELDEVGASLAFGASVERAGLHGRSLAEHLDVLLRLAGDALRPPLRVSTFLTAERGGTKKERRDRMAQIAGLRSRRTEFPFFSALDRN